jgi:hypothetical protein
MTKWKRITKNKPWFFKTFHRKLKFKQQEPHKNSNINLDALEGWAAHEPLVAPLV